MMMTYNRALTLAHTVMVLIHASFEEGTDCHHIYDYNDLSHETYGTLRGTGQDGVVRIRQNRDHVVLHVSDRRGAGAEESFELSAMNDQMIEAFATQARDAIASGTTPHGDTAPPATSVRIFGELVSLTENRAYPGHWSGLGFLCWNPVEVIRARTPCSKALT